MAVYKIQTRWMNHASLMASIEEMRIFVDHLPGYRLTLVSISFEAGEWIITTSGDIPIDQETHLRSTRVLI